MSAGGSAESGQLHVVTGAFGYSGRYIAQRLLAAGHRVRTLTNSPNRANPFGGRVEAVPFDFHDLDALIDHLRGAKVLYNTYWVRYEPAGSRHEVAVFKTQQLFAAALAAGVERVVHVSITNPDRGSPLPYFSGKARLELALKESGLSYGILRPAVLFGGEDILINNIAWALRRLPVFGVFGDGRYRLQPIHVDDFAALAVDLGARRDDVVVDAIGPETFSYRELAEKLGAILGCRRPVIGVPPWLGLAAATVLGWLVGDVMLTREEIEGLMADLLVTDSPPAGATRLTDWARENAARLGRRYASELARRRRRDAAYADL
jgi:NADH dehydrogenase